MAWLRGQRGRGVLRHGSALLGILVTVVAPARARAEGAGEAIDLRYEAPPGCPDREEIVRQIEARAPSGWSSADDRSFRVRIEHDGADFRARLDIERGGRVVSVREIHGATCEVAGTSMAVFVAIALDPAERAAADDGPPDRPTPRSSNEAPPPPPVPAAKLPPPRVPSAAWYMGSGLALGSVLHPSAAWGGRVHVELTRLVPRGAPIVRLAPELRLSMGWADFTERPARGGTAMFRFETARAEVCVRVDRAPLMAAACAGFEVGRLRATTRDLPHAGGENDPWYAPSATVRPGFFLLDWLSVEAEIGPLFPLTRGVFVLTSPERVVYRIPPVAAIAAVGIRIWAPLP